MKDHVLDHPPGVGPRASSLWDYPHGDGTVSREYWIHPWGIVDLSTCLFAQ